METPKYIVNMLQRSSYVYDKPYTDDPNYAAGYTIRINKKTLQTQAPTFQKEICRFQSWVQRTYRKRYKDNSPVVYVLRMPTKTHYCVQSAVVTIFDPVMKELERFIPCENKKGRK